MAFDLVTSNGQVLRAGAYGSAFPFSFFGVAQHNSTATEAYIGGCAKDSSSASNYLIGFRGDIGGDPIACRRVSSGGSGSNTPESAAYSADTRYNVLGVFAAADDVRLYVNGAKTTSAVSIGAPSTMTHQVIGSYWDNTGFANRIGGPIQQFAVWEIALTDDDAAMLSAGFSPRRVRPQYLRSYAPCIRGAGDMCYGPYSLLNVTIAAHMRTYGM